MEKTRCLIHKMYWNPCPICRELELKDERIEEFDIKKSGGISVKCNNWCNLKTNGICDYEDK